jgi:hypothetical protein
LLGSLLEDNESCFGNESCVLARPNIPLLVFGKPLRGSLSENASKLVHPESNPETFEFDMNKTSLPVSPENIKSAKVLIMLAPHVLFVQPGFKGPSQLVHPASPGHSLESQERGVYVDEL